MMKSNPKLIARCTTLAVALFALPCGAIAEVSLSPLFASHMVVQRDKPVRIWGRADRNEQVGVSFRGQTVTAQADDLGRWQAYLAPMPAGGPFTMTVRAGNTLTLDDVMAGDVWLASGQSNMEFPMTDLADADKKIAAATCPQVRLFRAQHSSSVYPLRDLDVQPWTPWSQCNPQTVASFSAIAYYFAKDISEREHVTVGVVESSWGGTLAEAWTSMDTLSSDAGLMPVFNAWAHMMDKQVERSAQAVLDEQDKAAGRPVPQRPWLPLPEMWEPAQLYNAMIAPLAGLPIRGVIWYQGEANSALDRAALYRKVFPAMIQDWRSKWGQGDFPFLFVQISNFNSPGEDWPTVRDAQRRTLQLANTGMAVSIDVGDPANVHPKDKLTVGTRLSLLASDIAYGDHVEDTGPLYVQVARAGSALQVYFDHAIGLRAKDGAPRGFEVAGADGRFVTAIAHITGDTLLVSSPAVPDPKNVRYDWASSPDGNMFNAASLPMSPFTSQP